MITASLRRGNRRASLTGRRLWLLPGLALLSHAAGAAPLSVPMPVSATVVQAVSVADFFAPVAPVVSTSSGWVSVWVVSGSPPSGSALQVASTDPAYGVVVSSAGGVEGASASGTDLSTFWQGLRAAGALTGEGLTTALWVIPAPSAETGESTPLRVIVAFN